MKSLGKILPFVLLASLIILAVWVATRDDKGPTRETISPSERESPTGSLTSKTDATTEIAPSTTPPRRLPDEKKTTAQTAAFLKIHVADSSGIPLEGAGVSCEPATPEAKAATGVTDESGDLRIGPLSPGELTVIVRKDGFVPEKREKVAIRPEAEESLDVRLHPGATIDGRVLENVTGKPIEGAQVAAVWNGPAENCPAPQAQRVKAKTNREGDFALEPLCRGDDYSVTASSPGYIPVTKRISGAADGSMDFTLDWGGSIEGMVVDAAGGAISDVTVSLLVPSERTFIPAPGRVMRGESFEMRSQIVTPASGTFQFLGLDSGEFLLKAWKNELVTVSEPDPARFEVTRGKSIAGVTLVLEPGGTLRARVLEHSSGEPIPGVELLIENFRYPAGKTGIPQRVGRSNHAGILIVGGLDRGTSWVRLLSTAYRFHNEGNPLFDVNPGETVEIDIALEVAARIAGRVIDPNGAPVGDAEVRVLEAGRSGYLRTARGALPERTGPDGAFVIEGLKQDATCTVAVDAENFPPKQIPDVPAGTEELEIQLDPPGSISGRVVRTSGEPIEGARIEARIVEGTRTWYSRRSGAPFATSDPSGRYTVSGLGEGDHTVRASAKGFAPGVRKSVAVSLGAETPDVDFVLGAGVRITGRVIVKGTNNGIPGVSVTAGKEDFEPTKTETDESGAYAVENLSPGTYNVSISPPEEGIPRFIVSPNDTQQTVVVKDTDVTGIDFELVAGGTVRGRVFTPDGRPVSEARVTLSSGGAGFDPRRLLTWRHVEPVVTAVDGSYELPGVPAGSGLLVIASDEDYAPSKSAPFDLEQGEEKDGIDVTLTEGGSASGKVMNEDKEPLEGATVWVINLPTMGFGPFREPNEVNTDTQGRYRIDHLPEGKVFLQARLREKETRVDQQSAMRMVDVKEGEETTNVDFVLKTKKGKFDAFISGVVMNEEGQGIAGCTIMAHMAGQGMSVQTEGRHGMNTSDNDGSFEIRNLRPGRFRVQVLHVRGYARGEGVEVEAPAENVEIILKRTGSVSGTVVSAETGQIIEDFSAHLSSERQLDIQMYLWGQRPQQFRSPDGSFAIDNVQPGSYRVVAKAEGLGVGKSEPFEVEPGEEITGIVVALRPGGTIVGIVAGQATYEPIAGAEVSYSPGTVSELPFQGLSRIQPREASTTTEENGTFVLEALTPGRGVVQAAHPGFASKTVEDVEISEDRPTEISIFLTAGGAIAGTVLGSDGQPLAGKAVSANPYDTPPGARSSQGMTDTAGEYQIDHLVPGGYTVALGGGPLGFAGGVESKPARVEEGKTTVVNFGGHAGAIYGTVTQAGLPSPGLQVTVTTSALPWAFMTGQSAVVNEHGQYRIEGIPPGEVELLLQRPEPPISKVLRTETVIMPQEGDLEVNLIVPGARVEGMVLAKESGRPIEGARVVLTPESLLDYSAVAHIFHAREAVTDRDGAFSISEVRAGSHRLEAAASGFGQERMRLYLNEGEVRQGIRLVLSAPGTLAGHVTFPEDFASLRGMLMIDLRVDEPGNLQVLSTVSGQQRVDENGDYRIENLAPGTYIVSANALGLASESRSGVRIQEGETTIVDFDLRAGMSVTIAVRDSEGQPVYDAEVQVLDPQGIPIQQTYYGLALVTQDVIKVRLFPGAYTFIVAKDGYQTTEQVIDLTGAEDEYRGEVVLAPEE